MTGLQQRTHSTLRYR